MDARMTLADGMAEVVVDRRALSEASAGRGGTTAFPRFRGRQSLPPAEKTVGADFSASPAPKSAGADSKLRLRPERTAKLQSFMDLTRNF